MELMLGVLFVAAMVIAAKGVKAPVDQEHALAIHRGQVEDMPRGNFLLAMGLLAVVAVVGIAMVGGGGTQPAQGGTTTSTHTDTWSHNQVNIGSEVRNVVIGSDGARLCEGDDGIFRRCEGGQP